jgi:hypothetical protein
MRLRIQHYLCSGFVWECNLFFLSCFYSRSCALSIDLVGILWCTNIIYVFVYKTWHIVFSFAEFFLTYRVFIHEVVSSLSILLDSTVYTHIIDIFVYKTQHFLLAWRECHLFWFIEILFTKFFCCIVFLFTKFCPLRQSCWLLWSTCIVYVFVYKTWHFVLGLMWVSSFLTYSVLIHEVFLMYRVSRSFILSVDLVGLYGVHS